MKAMATKIELTDRFVRTVKPEAKRVPYWDAKQPGLALVVEPSGHKSWKVAYRFAGKLEWYSLGNVGLATAREAAAKVLARVTLDENPQGLRREAKAATRATATLEAVCERYLEEHAKTRQKAWEQGDALRRRYVFPDLGNVPIGDIKRADIRKIFNELTARSRPVLANQVIAACGAVFSWAQKNDILKHNPAQGITRNPTKSRERVLSEAEVPLFWRAFDQMGGIAGAVFKLILLTGQRPGEVRHMRRQDLDIGDHTLQDRSGRPYKATGAWWTLPGSPEGEWPGTKDGRTHRVWLTPEAVAIIQSRPHDGILSKNRLQEAVTKANGLAGVGKDKRATAHDLRRTHGTTITALGFSREQTNRIQNHAEGGIASVYDRHNYAHEAVEIQKAVTGRILALAEDRMADNVVELPRSRAS